MIQSELSYVTPIATMEGIAGLVTPPPRRGLSRWTRRNVRPTVYWRRGVRRDEAAAFARFDLDDAPDDGNQACDYVILYRIAGREQALVIGVLHNRDLIPYMRSWYTR